MVESTIASSIPASGGLDPDLRPDQLVGEYRIERKLGQGGFGAVFKAVHPLIGKQVAIKVLSHRFSVDPEMVSRFVAEARAVNQIRHHNIIDIFSFGALDDGRHYYVMEYLDGETLDHCIRRMGHLPLADALPILRALARALDAAHAKGIAHRDLKAENVLLATNPDGVFPKLLDFGIAKLLAPDDGLLHKTRTGAPMGTPHYMSPEQCHGRDVDHRTDLYAFGVLTYVMLTGVYPLDGDDYMTILMRQIHDEPAPASALQPALPAGVDRVIGWLMRKDPAARPPALIDAVRELERVASGAPSTLVAPDPGTAGSRSALPVLPTLPASADEPGTGGAPHRATPAGTAIGALSAGAVSEIRTREPGARWAPHRLLAAGAAVATLAIVGVVAIRSAHRDDAPPAPAVGSIHVASEPAGADVVFDGTPLAAKTPVTIDGVAVGTHHVLRVEAAHRQPYAEAIDIPATGGAISVVAKLDAISDPAPAPATPPPAAAAAPPAAQPSAVAAPPAATPLPAAAPPAVPRPRATTPPRATGVRPPDATHGATVAKPRGDAPASAPTNEPSNEIEQFPPKTP